MSDIRDNNNNVVDDADDAVDADTASAIGRVLNDDAWAEALTDPVVLRDMRDMYVRTRLSEVGSKHHVCKKHGFMYAGDNLRNLVEVIEYYPDRNLTNMTANSYCAWFGRCVNLGALPEWVANIAILMVKCPVGFISYVLTREDLKAAQQFMSNIEIGNHSDKGYRCTMIYFIYCAVGMCVHGNMDKAIELGIHMKEHFLEMVHHAEVEPQDNLVAHIYGQTRNHIVALKTHHCVYYDRTFVNFIGNRTGCEQALYNVRLLLEQDPMYDFLLDMGSLNDWVPQPGLGCPGYQKLVCGSNVHAIMFAY